MWERTEFPSGCNRLACQFLMIGEPLLRMVEHPELVAAARLLIFGESAWLIAPAFLITGTVSALLLGLFAERFVARSRWLREFRQTCAAAP